MVRAANDFGSAASPFGQTWAGCSEQVLFRKDWILSARPSPAFTSHSQITRYVPAELDEPSLMHSVTRYVAF